METAEDTKHSKEYKPPEGAT